MPKKSVRQMFRKYPDVVTIPQVCEMLGVSRNYAYLLVKQGKLTRLDFHNAGFVFEVFADLSKIIIRICPFLFISGAFANLERGPML